jgi:hypothetical protein
MGGLRRREVKSKMNSKKKEEKLIRSKYYVSMTDSVMSGGGIAKGKMHKLVFECDSYEEAQIVYENAKARGDMQWIKISKNKQYYDKTKYFTRYKTREYGYYWYIKDYFKKGLEINAEAKKQNVIL